MNTHHLLSTYGYGAVFLLVAVESLGVPLPGETILIAAGIYAGSTHRLSVWLIFLTAVAAVVAGGSVGFWIGDKGGYRLLRRYGRYVRLDAGKVKIGRYVFDRHGGQVVFFGRFVAILRTYVAFLAGTNRMPWRQFSAFNGAGGLVWAAIYSFVPYAVGGAIDRLSTPFDVGVSVAAMVVVVLVILVVRHHAGRLQAKAEAAYPGPLPDL